MMAPRRSKGDTGGRRPSQQARGMTAEAAATLAPGYPFTRHELIRELQKLDMVKMSPEGNWIPTREGRRTLAMIDLLREMVDGES